MTTFNCIPNEILAKQVGPYLTEEDLGEFALVRSRIVREIRYTHLIEPLKRGIRELWERGPFVADEIFQQFLVSLIALPDDVNPRYYERLTNGLMGHKALNGAIQHHANIAHLIATSPLPISPKQIHRFCSNLIATELLNQLDLWVGGRCLAQYPLPPEERETLWREHLINKAKDHITILSAPFHLNGIGHLTIQTIRIDPKVWFNPPPHAGVRIISEPLLGVLKDRILKCRDENIDTPILVIMKGSVDAVLRFNYTLPLALFLADMNIHFVHQLTIDVERIAATKRHYALSALPFDQNELAELAERYPRAIGAWRP